MKDKFSLLKISTIREGLLLVVDLFIVSFSFLLSFLLSQLYVISNVELKSQVIINLFLALLLVIGLCIVTFWLSGVFKVIWRKAKPWDYFRIVIAVVVATVVFGIMDSYWLKLVYDPELTIGSEVGMNVFPTYIIFAVFSIFFMSGARVCYQIYFIKWHKKNKQIVKKRTLIIGAGSTASAILDEIEKGETNYLPLFALDDDSEKKNRIFCGVEVLGGLDKIQEVCEQYKIDVIIFAIPSLDNEKRAKVLKECTKTGCEIKVIPLVSEIIENTSLVGQMRKIKIADLLERPQISFEEKGVKEYIEGKTIFVTGGGGSIGSELCRQIITFKPKRVVIIEIYENCAYDIQQEIRNLGIKDIDFLVEILSVTDYDKLKDVFEQYHPNIVFHAAAHKHVPLMETNPEEAVKNNVYGTLNTVNLCIDYNVEKFILISTDKAVNPTNVMGATKRCCEKIMQMASRRKSNTEFAAVRFGNVLGSNGSVIPLFKKQIEKGGPVTVTHKDIIRYFMTIPEAVSLVLQAGAFAKGGEIFILDMGEQVKIVTLAENLIKAMGYVPYVDIDIVFTGLRPGEKLYEELLMNEEGIQKTDNNKIYIGKQIEFDDKEFLSELDKMKDICLLNDKDKVIEQLKVLVPTFKHDIAQYNRMKAHNEAIKLEFVSNK